MSALVFLDTETTGLDPSEDYIWEFAAIRREDDGSETRHQWFVTHNPHDVNLPPRYRADHDARYDAKLALSVRYFCDLLRHVLRDDPRIVGAAPWFDAGFLAKYIDPCWSHRLVCVETLAAGYYGRLMNGLADAASAFGIQNPGAHTAMGDAETAMHVYDAVMAVR